MAEERLSPVVFAEADDRGGVIHVANIKGGVGKSTLATNLTAALSRRGPALIIDLDVQGSVSVALGVNEARAPYTSWDFFRRRFSSGFSVSECVEMLDASALITRFKDKLIGGVVGGGSVDDAIVEVDKNLHLVPAGVGLFNAPAGYQYGNFLHNLSIVKERYGYIVIDTPSVWNRLTRFIYLNSDLNLIPVTLSALSTRSFKEYLSHVKWLISRNPGVRLRIIKNGVGRSDGRSDGKARTINLNRRFLDSLCEQAAVRGEGGVSLLPQSVMFDLEIPDSPAIRDAQDAGKTLYDHGGDPVAARALDLLAQNVQNVLNGISAEAAASAPKARIMMACRLCAALLIIAVIWMNRPVPNIPAPRPVAPQQIVESGSAAAFVHTFGRGDNIARLAKHAICVFRAVVPSQRDVTNYLMETVDAYNMTRVPGEPRIVDYNNVPIGTRLRFYPPMNITNPQEKAMVPAYRFFMDMIDDVYPYVTGDWCERGSGGGQPHYAIDVAGTYGSDVISPVDGIAALKTDALSGRTVGVKFDNDDAVIFFSHLDKRYVEEGDTVKKGMPIGTIGMTGRTSGPHAHIGYGIKSISRHDIVFGKNNGYRVTDPKHLFYQKAFAESVE